MRVDRFLFFIRLLKSRTQAQALIEEGHLRIDGRRVAKPSEDVVAGSVLAFPLRGVVRVIRVLTIPTRRGPPAEARAHYLDLDPANVSQVGGGD